MKIPRPHRPSARSFGFTMVEMLTVVGIIALLVALVTPALVDVIRSTRLSSAGDSLVTASASPSKALFLQAQR